MNYSVKTLGASVCLFSMLVGTAEAATTTTKNYQSNWYAGISGDLTWLRHSDTGGGGNVNIGYKFKDWRLEAEAGYHGADGDEGFSSTHYFTYMGNLYYDFNATQLPSTSDWHITPYIGAGLGEAQVHYGHSSLANTYHHNTNKFAYNGMAGLTFISPSAPNTDWTLGYRYLGTHEPNLHASNIELGVRFHF